MQRLGTIGMLILVLGLVGVTSALVSCSRDGPHVPVTGEGPEFAVAIDPVTAEPLGQGGNGGKGGKGGKIGGDTVYTAVSIDQFAVDPGVGGTFTVGHFTIMIPPGAIHEPITLKIKDKSVETGSLVCEVTPHGYVFDAPVTLQIDLKGTTGEHFPNPTCYWFNDVAGVWVDIGGTTDPITRILSVDLEHFSQYGGGRGGW